MRQKCSGAFLTIHMQLPGLITADGVAEIKYKATLPLFMLH